MSSMSFDFGIICYGNILRSQVLEQYIRHHAMAMNKDISIFSAGVAGSDEFPDKEKLFGEIKDELTKRNIPHALNRNPWDSEVEDKIIKSNYVICADSEVKETVFKRMGNRIDQEKVYTYYEVINEGETSFEDTYDYENNRQDPVRFKNAFDELERIALKILSTK